MAEPEQRTLLGVQSGGVEGREKEAMVGRAEPGQIRVVCREDLGSPLPAGLPFQVGQG